VITTRTPVADIADHEGSSALRRDLEQLSSGAGAKLFRALGVKGDEAELRSASDEFSGHCFALTLLGSYLTDAYNGDIRCRSELSGHLAQDVRQGAHARKVMESYQTWLGESLELSVLRMLGLFDRPADEKALEALLKSPAIPGFTESLTDLRPTAWRKILSKLRRARLLAAEDPHYPGNLDTHPLVREYFGEQLRSQRTETWKECNRRLYDYYRTLAPQLPNSFREMEPLFSAVSCGCNAGLFREALHEVYIPRIQRGDASYAAKVLGTRGALLSVLIHFFKDASWESPLEMGVEEQSLSADDQLFILTEAALYLTALRGHESLQACICYERVEFLCNSLNRPRLLYVALQGQWRYSYAKNKPSAALQIAERIHSIAQEQDDPTLMIGAYNFLAGTLYYLGDMGTAHQYVMRGVQIWRSGGVQSNACAGELESGAVVCLGLGAICEWHLGKIASCKALVAEAISLAKELNDMSALALVLQWATNLAYYERDPADVERLASDSIELSTRLNFARWLTHGTILRGWARSASGDTAQGIAWIDDGIRDHRVTGTMQDLPFLLALKAEALHLGGRSSEALGAIREAEALVERSGERSWLAELHRLRGVFLSAVGADEKHIETSFYEAIRIAREQKSVSLEKRAKETYAEYRRQKAGAP
jgi:tetratricopeptide (TPR) repeat protein